MENEKNSNRIYNLIENINYTETREFFKHRATKFKESAPYTVTMYQDSHSELVKERNEAEIAVLKPLLNINENSSVLDIACGIGRWSDAITENIRSYCGIDFSQELIDIANKRNKHKENHIFLVGAANETEKVVVDNGLGKFNTILLIGILIYLNENDVIDTLMQVTRLADQHAAILIREPIGLRDRLTLKNFYSEELKDNYNAIYRTQSELEALFEKTLIKEGFIYEKKASLFENKDLKNRKETEQYYFVFKR